MLQSDLPCQDEESLVDLRPPNCIELLIDFCFGVWRSLVARMVWVHEAPGSNPGTPTPVFCNQIAGALLARERLGYFTLPHDYWRLSTHLSALRERLP